MDRTRTWRLGLRALVGHASRSLITVSTYLKVAAASDDVRSPHGYYALIRGYASKMGAADVTERGRQAGRDLGADPAATVDALVDRVLDELEAVDDDPLIGVTDGLGIRLNNYLPTRTFELAVHSLNIVRASGVAFTLPTEVLKEMTVLATRIAVKLDEGERVLLTLTGRDALPTPFLRGVAGATRDVDHDRLGRACAAPGEPDKNVASSEERKPFAAWGSRMMWLERAAAASGSQSLAPSQASLERHDPLLVPARASVALGFIRRRACRPHRCMP